MSVQVQVPQIFRKHTGGAKTVIAEGRTVQEVLDSLDRTYPGFRERLLDGKGLHRFVNIYRNEEDIRYLEYLDTKVREGDVISIFPAVAGGGRLDS